MGVSFFFGLSGFVITLSYFDRIKTFNSLIKFQIRRFFRVYPIHLFVLLIVLIIQIFKFILIKNGIPAGSEAFGSWYTLKDFILNIFLLQAVVDWGYFLSWNGAAWSISVEFYTYLIFGIIIFLLRGSRVFFIIFLITYQLYFTELFAFLDNIFYGNLQNTLNDCLLPFFSGSLMFFIYEKIKFKINDLTLVFLAIIFYFLISLINNYLFISVHLFWAFVILLFALLKEDSFIFKLLNFKFFIYLGTLSYSFYMIHQVVLYIMIQILKLLNLGFSFSSDAAASTGSIFYDTCITVIYISISLVIASGMNKYIETRFRIKSWQ